MSIIKKEEKGEKVEGKEEEEQPCKDSFLGNST